MSQAENLALELTEQGYVPDRLIRHGIRRLLRERLQEIAADDCESHTRALMSFIKQMQQAEVAPLAHKANEQHYEVPASFYTRALGKHLKYSSCYWPEGTESLDEAEAAALEQTCEHARLDNHQKILELGCGWGSLTLWMAGHYPQSRITAVSNSSSQRDFILQRAAERGLNNIEVITADMNDFQIDEQFDRIVSVEMFEHMRNYPLLFERISRWLKPEGLFFMHIFVHRSVPYAFEDKSDNDWMSRHFFSGGIMPSDDLPLYFQQHLTLQDRWRWDGRHYEKTANAWLERMDSNKTAMKKIFADIYGEQDVQQWWMRWRMFFMACAELFGYDDGQQWWVSHYLFRKH
ncbi:MAG: cyclopropane-fatty-acyl-phospholipid synthase family protein [Pseudomonadota bacterium]|nr:cyclopropane-fatty-acyl-phospholipid synthase family protein [Pseudomonadota bacterium]